jgi:predicted chitinase
MPVTVNAEQLKAIYPNSAAKGAIFAPYLADAMAEFGIDTPQRAAYFLGQVGEESGELRYTEEIASGAAYEGRRDLGNTEKGDGERYKGRGLIQITGRANYALAAEALKLPLLESPSVLATAPNQACRSAAWFWKRIDGNSFADIHDINGLTRKINGGLNGLSARKEYTDRALQVFNLEPPAPVAAPAVSQPRGVSSMDQINAAVAFAKTHIGQLVSAASVIGLMFHYNVDATAVTNDLTAIITAVGGLAGSVIAIFAHRKALVVQAGK